MHYPIAPILGAVVVALLLATLVAGRLARMGFPMPSPERRIGCVDGLRGYLALLVMVHHFVIWLQIAKLGGTWSAPSIALLNQFGAAGVGLFFMTTGLVFYPRVLAGFRACDWRAVYISRIFRLLPAIVLSLLLIALVIMLRTGRKPDFTDAKPALIWIFALGEPPLLGYPDSGRLNAYVLWSLYFEWIFYLTILPACAFASDVLRRLRLPSWLAPACLLAFSLAAFMTLKPPGLPQYLPSFAVGMLAYECQRHPALAQRLRGPVVTLAAALLLVAGMTSFATPYTTALPFFSFFFACVACGNDFGGLLRTRGALVLGECSYGIYLSHGVALDILYVDFAGLVGRLSAAQLRILLPISAIAVTIIATANFLLIERPAIRLGAFVTRNWQNGMLKAKARQTSNIESASSSRPA